MHVIARRRFLAAMSASGLVGASDLPAMALPLQSPAGAGNEPSSGEPHAGFPRQPQDWAREVVGAAHRDLDRVKALVEQHPALANAAWDWGFGDWETPLGAASHTGRRPIAEYLLSKGARADLFCAAMLGRLDVVKAALAADPAAASVVGPHGITLLAHAQAGGEPAAAVVKFLESHGGADPAATSLPLTAEQRAAYMGLYRIGAFPFEITERREQLSFKPQDGADRILFRVGDHEFHPSGAPMVRLRFTMQDHRAASLTIHDGDMMHQATRA